MVQEIYLMEQFVLNLDSISGVFCSSKRITNKLKQWIELDDEALKQRFAQNLSCTTSCCSSKLESLEQEKCKTVIIRPHDPTDTLLMEEIKYSAFRTLENKEDQDIKIGEILELIRNKYK